MLLAGFTRKQIAYSWFSFNDCFLVDPLTIMLAWKRTSKWLSHASILLTPPQIRFLVTRRLSVLEVGRLFLWQIWLLVQLLEDSYLIGAARFLVGSAIRIMNVIAASRSGRFQPLCGDYERIRIMRRILTNKLHPLLQYPPYGSNFHRFPSWTIILKKLEPWDIFSQQQNRWQESRCCHERLRGY